MIRLDDGERLLRDYWPAEVTLDGGACRSKVFKLARVYVTDRRVIVVATSNSRPTKVFEDVRADVNEVLHRNGVQGGRSEISTTSGKVFVGAAHGCGCSSPLRALPVPR